MYFRELNKETYFDYYTIDKGDNLYKISRKYNINPNLLASLHGLDMNDYIFPWPESWSRNYSVWAAKFPLL